MTDSSGQHVILNRAAWDSRASDYETAGRQAWESPDPYWGIWRVPEAQLGLLPDVRGLDVVELGCGTGYVSAWLARRGARPIALDNSAVQLATARRLQREFGLDFPLIHADAERVPLRDGCFDLAISEYGASIWCDPYRWVPEAARLLRPGGQLLFLTNGTILMLCTAADQAEDEASGDRLVRDYFGLHRLEWPADDDPSVEFHLAYGDWIRLLRATGFEVEDLVEVRPSEGSSSRYRYVTLEWSRRWPSEEVWKARRRG